MKNEHTLWGVYLHYYNTFKVACVSHDSCVSLQLFKSWGHLDFWILPCPHVNRKLQGEKMVYGFTSLHTRRFVIGSPSAEPWLCSIVEDWCGGIPRNIGSICYTPYTHQLEKFSYKVKHLDHTSVSIIVRRSDNYKWGSGGKGRGVFEPSLADKVRLWDP